MPYDSAKDLPSFQEMSTNMKALQVMGALFLPAEDRKKNKQLRHDFENLTRVVDDFYNLFGPKHWIFHNYFHVDDMEVIITEHAGDPDAAQEALIAWYQEPGRLAFQVRRLQWHPAWRARLDVLHQAVDDYMAGRYSSMVLVVISAMDGFVNDLDPASRKGLHARDADSMEAWDSVAGHSKGLAATMSLFTKSFRKLDQSEVHEVYRHGLIHGMLPNYNNVIVATKCWNLLFAVDDYAHSLDKKRQHDEPKEPVTWRDLGKQIRHTAAVKKAIEEHQAYELAVGDPGFVEHPVYQRSAGFLEALQYRRWSLFKEYLAFLAGDPSYSQLKACYRDEAEIATWRICKVRQDMPSVCGCEVELIADGDVYKKTLVWYYEDDKGTTMVPGLDDGEWKIVFYGNLLTEPVATKEDAQDPTV